VHKPALVKEVIDSLNLRPGYKVLDATVGGGGHAIEILNKIIPGGLLIGLDQDPQAIAIADAALKDFKGSYRLINENFRNMDAVLSNEGIKSLDAVLLDIGVSSYQLDQDTRGFSIKEDAALDMRMDPRNRISAHDIVNRYSQKDLADILYNFGEERFSRRIAKYITETRSRKAIETTHELAAIVRKAIGFRKNRSRIDPATRTFQAIRIAVNDELGALEEGLRKAVALLGIGARICVISFHSLEDRIAKNIFKEYASLGVLKVITKKPVRPQEEEVISNPRARSGRLRVAERIQNEAF